MIHLLLFVLTFATTTIAGLEWSSGAGWSLEWGDLRGGLPYSLSILFILGCHEFGHYFAAKYHDVQVTLPYFIPFPPLPGFLNFGTMGAVIRTRSRVPNNQAMFDIGVFGPIAGFVATLLVLIYGFTHLPGQEYITTIHPDYFTDGFGRDTVTLIFGDPILFAILRDSFTQPTQFVPPMSEIYHYPFLCVGWFGLFITALNMIPVGQLDGGHVVYSMFGDAVQTRISRIAIGLLLLLGAIGLAELVFDWQLQLGWIGWFLWAAILVAVIKIRHPPVIEFRDLDPKRRLLGYVSLAILFLSFTPVPFTIHMGN